MPLRKDIKSVIVLGSGPIVIGQAAEFDYAGTQACRALMEEGLEVILVNSNPATIMTDKKMASKIYIEPMTIEAIKKIILKEKPDSILATLGGQTGLNLAMELYEEGFLDKYNVKLLGANPTTIKRAEDRQEFKNTMIKINEPIVASKVVNNIEDALEFVKEIGYPIIVRPAYTLGGTGGGIAHNDNELIEIAKSGLMFSRVNQILIERCISGWKEIEYEVIRDHKGNVITVCNMENIDPVGVHTGDSIVVAPSQTLSDKEYQMLRSSALNIISELGIEGGCNVQYALNPFSFEYAVIEVNPRVSRSSALASKATGYPIAKVATKIAIGYSLDEIKNSVTGKTFACFEPTLDYCVIKFPRWPFDKFVFATRTLGTQMKATGEVMSIASSFEAAIMKAIRSIEMGYTSLISEKLQNLSYENIHQKLYNVDDERLFVIAEALRRSITIDEIYNITKIDKWFLNAFLNIINLENKLKKCCGKITDDLYLEAKKMGFLDLTIEELTNIKIDNNMKRFPVYKMVDTCAAEFEAQTPYYYSTFDDDNETKIDNNKKKIMVLGSGPIRIGQGIEFDYCSVHCVWALKKLGYETIIVNNNPETVSTDFDTADRLYFEPLTAEDIESIINIEKPYAAIVQFGGQTAINLAKHLEKIGVKILGTNASNINDAEDREKFDIVLEKCNISRPKGFSVMKTADAVKVANKLGYPVLVRPSYVLGGQGMEIAFKEENVLEFMEIITRNHVENPVLIDKYLMGLEVEVDAICDGDNILIPGIMEHLERAGVHSGDSISVYPTISLSVEHKKTIIQYTKLLAQSLHVIGLINIQFVIYNNKVFVIEVNPRSSRTVPYISKVTNIPMIELATRCMFGEKLINMNYGINLHPESNYYAVKVPVFSFQKLHDLDTQLGPEMKSTGEVLGISKSFRQALLKGLLGAGFIMKNSGTALISVRDTDKQEAIKIAERFEKLGFDIYATAGTAHILNNNMIAANSIRNIDEDSPNIIDFIENHSLDYIINTSVKGRHPNFGSVRIRRKAVEKSIPCLTSLDTANALLRCLEGDINIENCDMININDI